MDPTDAGSSESPPDDAEEWTDEQWLDWLKATDASPADQSDERAPSPSSRIVQSAGGQVLGQSMIGLANAIFGPKKDEVVIVEQANSDPESDEPFTIDLVPDHPEQSSVTFHSTPEDAGQT